MKARVSRRQNESCHTCNKKIPSFDLSKVWPLQQNSYHQCMLYDQICTLNICTFYIDTARLNKAFSNFMKRNVASDAWALLKCAIHLSSQCTAWTNIKKPTWLILLHRLSGSLHWNQGSYPNGKVVQQDSLCFSYSMQPLHRSLLAYGLSVPFHIEKFLCKRTKSPSTRWTAQELRIKKIYYKTKKRNWKSWPEISRRELCTSSRLNSKSITILLYSAFFIVHCIRISVAYTECSFSRFGMIWLQHQK